MIGCDANGDESESDTDTVYYSTTYTNKSGDVLRAGLCPPPFTVHFWHLRVLDYNHKERERGSRRFDDPGTVPN
jgi:hypothetical protein